MFGRFAFARLLAAATICFALAASAAPPASADPTPKDVIKVYAESRKRPTVTRSTWHAHSSSPSMPSYNLRTARAMWNAARIPYMQTEAFRFGSRRRDLRPSGGEVA